MKKVNRRRMNDAGSHNIWRSYSDMMSGLLLLFVLIMAVCLMQAQKNYNEKLTEQASRLQAQNALDKTQAALSLRESEIDAQSLTLTELQAALDAKANALITKESELEEAQITLSGQQALLTTQESELANRDAALLQSQQLLDAQTQLMSEQQQKIDQIIGVKANLIDSLNKEFSANQIKVNIDAQTGAIVLDSNVMFEFDRFELTPEGAVVLSKVLPIYCNVLLSDQYKDYLAEIIIDGYTDSDGSYLDNLKLSQNRAYAVAEYLVTSCGGFLNAEQQKMLEEKLTANGRSKSNLILDANGNEDAAASRRVEVKFRLKDDEMIQELSNIIADAKVGETSPAGETAPAGEIAPAQQEAVG